MWQELRVSRETIEDAEEALEDADLDHDGTIADPKAGKTMRQAVTQIIVADVSMSLDNVLAVAGAAQHHFWALVFGLGLSVVLMGVASSFVARLLQKYHWIAWLGFLIILYVAIKMVYNGADELMAHALPAIPLLKH
jgi:YjbE family integral membrane protein